MGWVRGLARASGRAVGRVPEGCERGSCGSDGRICCDAHRAGEGGWWWRPPPGGSSRARACCRCAAVQAPPIPQERKGPHGDAREGGGGGGGGAATPARAAHAPTAATIRGWAQPRARRWGRPSATWTPSESFALSARPPLRQDARRPHQAPLRGARSSAQPTHLASPAPARRSARRWATACAQQQAYWVAGPPSGCKATESPSPSCLQTHSQHIPIPSARIARLTLLADPAALQQRWPQRLRRTRRRRRPGGPHRPLRPRPPVKPPRRRSLTESGWGPQRFGDCWRQDG